jgi:ferredoxin-NADP reductase
MNVTLGHTEQLNEHVRTFWFKPDRMPHYTAGQFIELTVPHDNPDERGVRHWFTLSSSPTDELLSITTKFASGRSSTFKQALFAKNPGDTLVMSEPMGDFVLPIDKTIPLLFVAGGIGVTPIHSMVKWLVDTGEQRQAQLFYAAETPQDFVFTDLFKQHGLPVTYLVSQPDATWQGETGHITAEHILQSVGDAKNTLIFISGPEPMTESLVDGLKAAGIPENRLVTDYFPGYPSF